MVGDLRLIYVPIGLDVCNRTFFHVYHPTNHDPKNNNNNNSNQTQQQQNNVGVVHDIDYRYCSFEQINEHLCIVNAVVKNNITDLLHHSYNPLWKCSIIPILQQEQEQQKNNNNNKYDKNRGNNDSFLNHDSINVFKTTDDDVTTTTSSRSHLENRKMEQQSTTSTTKTYSNMFELVVSMSHVIGDVYTYYRVYNMLTSSTCSSRSRTNNTTTEMVVALNQYSIL